MYRQENRTEFDPRNQRSVPVIKRPRAELVIEPREAPLPGQERFSTIVLSSGSSRFESVGFALAACLCLLVVAAVHARDIAVLAGRWLAEPSLSFALAVPAFAAYLLWSRRDQRPGSWQGSWWGLVIVLVGSCIAVAATWGYYHSARPLALLLTLAGICVLAGGRGAWHWCCPALMFLGFALPLPARLLTELSPPLQRWTAAASAYLLVTLGVPAVSVGSELILSDSRIAVSEAWGGLETVAACLAVCVAVALLVQAPFWERSLLVLSALPIALFGNVVRLTADAALPEVPAKWLLREAGCWLLIPLALGLLWIERRFFSRVLIPARARGGLGLECGGART